MCGFLGFSTVKDISDEQVKRALYLIKHRGPNNQTYKLYDYKKSKVCMGHARLSIIDLAEHSNQPFLSSCGRYSLIFNGEIYNYKEIRQELIAHGNEFLTEGDTEVLLQAWIKWGAKCLPRIIGMFAFVVFDRSTGRITAARDAFGIKPFFYCLDKKGLYFASELPALLELSGVSRKVNYQKSYDYLVNGDYDSNQETFIDGVFHLSPGHLFEFDSSGDSQSITPVPWWKPDLSNQSSISFDEAKIKLRELFLDSVRLHLRSDVPIGAALSGGIDSSAVVCAMRYLEPELDIKTFSYIANDKTITEEKWVDAINECTDTSAHKVYATEKSLEADLDKMLLAQGEPFGSTSIYAQYRVFETARNAGIKVTLDGQGADELLAGYVGYPGQRFLSLIEKARFRKAMQFIRSWSDNFGDKYFNPWRYALRLLLPQGVYLIARKLMGRDSKPSWLKGEVLRKAGVDFTEHRPRLKRANRGQRVKEAMAESLQGRGLPSLLRHGDRNSMSFSIESRVPFLTIPLAEFLLSLPEEYLISQNATTKHVFREAMRGIVPDSHLDRKDKIGFETPQLEWLLKMNKTITKWISEAPHIEFIDKDVMLRHYQEVVEGKRPFDQRVWRWVNYLRWYNLIGAEC